MKIYLIRHGETKWNELGKFQGCKDIELNDKGRSQADEAGKVLKDYGIKHIYCSDLKRAKETAEIINKYINVDITEDKRMRELNLGDWEGKKWDAVNRDYADFMAEWNLHKGTMPVPGGESYGEAAKRAMKFLSDMVHSTDEDTVAVVSHGAVLASLICSIGTGGNMDRVDDFIIKNCGVNEILYDRDSRKFSIIKLDTPAGVKL